MIFYSPEIRPPVFALGLPPLYAEMNRHSSEVAVRSLFATFAQNLYPGRTKYLIWKHQKGAHTQNKPLKPLNASKRKATAAGSLFFVILLGAFFMRIEGNFFFGTSWMK